MNTPSLDYGNPAVFFQGVYRRRSGSALVGIAALALFGIIVACMTLAVPMDQRFRFPVGGLSAILLLGAGYLAALAALGREDAVRITEEGIGYGRYFWPWARIKSVGGTADPRGGGVTVQFTVGYAGVPLPRPLPTTPPLTPDQFARLMAAAGTYLSRVHPHVKVNPQPCASD